jgi:hypothetical protein
MQWNIGAVKITKVVELELTGHTRFILPQATYEAVRAIPGFVRLLPMRMAASR